MENQIFADMPKDMQLILQNRINELSKDKDIQAKLLTFDDADKAQQWIINAAIYSLIKPKE